MNSSTTFRHTILHWRLGGFDPGVLHLARSYHPAYVYTPSFRSLQQLTTGGFGNPVHSDHGGRSSNCLNPAFGPIAVRPCVSRTAQHGNDPP